MVCNNYLRRKYFSEKLGKKPTVAINFDTFGHSRGKLPQDGTEAVSQKWCGIFGSEKALTVTNTATYGSHADQDTMYLSLTAVEPI